MNTRETSDTAVHLRPVWRNRANFVIAAAIAGLPGARWEQLWARQVSENQFEICCIPFFVYDLTLGDIVETHPSADKFYVVSRVLVDGGHCVFRVWFGDIANQGVQHSTMDDVERRLADLGCELEWHSHDLLGVAVEQDRAQPVADYLQELHDRGRIMVETGCSR